VVNAALELTDVNEGLISPGKRGLVKKTQETLIKGLVMAADPPME
jgi:hypothetical protein